MKTMRIMVRIAIAAVAAGSIGLAGADAAAPPTPVRQASVLAAPQLAAPPKIDGVLDDPAWAAAQPLRDWAYRTGAVRCQTEGWVARDAAHLYFAGRCHDDNLAGLVAANSGKALWKNDCVELFVVPDKDPLFFTHLILSCDGQFAAPAWVPDEWGEPSEAPPIALRYATGREAGAWTFEVAVPLSAFGRKVAAGSVWALGFNREKQSAPAEVSSFQGGFNQPGQYPDLVFDGRTVVVDGLGLRNLGAEPRTVRVTLRAGQAAPVVLELSLPPGRRVPIPWAERLGAAAVPEAPLTVEAAEADGRLLVRETYRLAAPPPPPVDLANLPPAKFAPSAFDDPAFFPIAVWLQPAGTATEFAALGVNLFVGGIDAYPKPRDREYLDVLQAAGCLAIVPFKEAYVKERLHEHPAFLGWMHGDEPDNVNQATGQVKESPEVLLAGLARIRAADPAHRVFLNLGQGVAEERFVGRGATLAQYREYPQACDIICFDVYPCNSVLPAGPDRLHLVAKGIDRLRAWAGPERPAWAWIEVNQFGGDNAGRCPTPEEVRAQVWMALVHGARGYGFFCHSWCRPWLTATFGKELGSSVTAIAPGMRTALAALNAEVKALAPALNAPGEAVAVSASGGGRVDATLRRHGGRVWLFAVNMRRQATRATFGLAPGTAGRARRLGAEGEVPVAGEGFADDFAPYAVRLYELVP